jgi:hypothetical protein
MEYVYQALVPGCLGFFIHFAPTAVGYGCLMSFLCVITYCIIGKYKAIPYFAPNGIPRIDLLRSAIPLGHTILMLVFA